MDPFTLMVVGTGMEVLGRYGANIQEAIAERANAKFYQDQAEYNIAAVERDIRAAEREAGYKVGLVGTTTAGSGLDVGTGSALTNMATAIADGIENVEFTRRKGELEIKLAQLRQRQTEAKAAILSSPGYNILQASTYATSGYGQYLTNANKTKDNTEE